jgi:predicted RNase H-like HicB family nuclease
MKIVIAVIERSSEGYGIHIPDIPGYVGLGCTEEEAKNDLREAINEVVADCKMRGIADDIYGGHINFEYKYDYSLYKTYISEKQSIVLC